MNLMPQIFFPTMPIFSHVKWGDCSCKRTIKRTRSVFRRVLCSYARAESNRHFRLRRPALYPLGYGRVLKHYNIKAKKCKRKNTMFIFTFLDTEEKQHFIRKELRFYAALCIYLLKIIRFLCYGISDGIIDCNCMEKNT